MTTASNHTARSSPPRLALWFAFVVLLCGSCASWAASAEEYYSIGMSYFEIGKFEEAEKWLNRAKAVNKTRVASEYNLGRIAFETGRYQEAAAYFEMIIKQDPNNILALKAAAYTRIKTGEFDKADELYRRVLALSPESADDGYNYALVLYAMEKYADVERVLGGYQFALMDNAETMLLYARAQKAQGKVEALDSYAKWLANNQDPAVRYEYAQLLETQQLYARALEEYRLSLSGLNAADGALKRSDLRFAIARLLLVADGDSDEGITELREAVSEGYADIAALEKLQEDARISAANKAALASIIGDARQKRAGAAQGAAQPEAQAEAGPEAESGGGGE